MLITIFEEENDMLLERMDYIVRKIDGDYAYLEREGVKDEELKCVARALLPAEISEGCALIYEMMQYTLRD